uniref:Uncharacterized protein n=1 Tax=Pipistrellus kuhlii TaxID=59472 RepID=A0A7J7VN36_PIPKU|nr:hypothetical protein mPipKuh1_008406 [Pipistrellus kuhlii]
MISTYLFSFILSSFHYTLYQQSYFSSTHTGSSLWNVLFQLVLYFLFTFLKPLMLPLSSSHLAANFALYCTNKFEVIRKQTLITITICPLASVPINPTFLCVTIEKLSVLLSIQGQPHTFLLTQGQLH